MIDDLRRISADIEALLADDPYPESIRPDYLAAAVRDYPSRGGKRLRPAILTWCCGLLGGDTAKTRYPAAAVEVFHNWTLVHDDIIDRDTVRRGKPSEHVLLAQLAAERFGLDEAEAARAGCNFALLAGDLQQGWANALLLRAVESGVAPEIVVALSQRFQVLANAALISGEALDVEFALRHLEDIRADEVREMLIGKTGALLRFAAEAGAMIALETADPKHPQVALLGDFATACGIAFQLRDDYLGVFGDFNKLGKGIGGDLREKKATTMLLGALAFANDTDRQTLRDLLGHDSYSEEELEIARRIMRESGAAAATEAEGERLVEKARTILAQFPDSSYRQNLLVMVNFLIDRES